MNLIKQYKHQWKKWSSLGAQLCALLLAVTLVFLVLQLIGTALPAFLFPLFLTLTVISGAAVVTMLIFSFVANRDKNDASRPRIVDKLGAGASSDLLTPEEIAAATDHLNTLKDACEPSFTKPTTTFVRVQYLSRSNTHQPEDELWLPWNLNNRCELKDTFPKDLVGKEKDLSFGLLMYLEDSDHAFLQVNDQKRPLTLNVPRVICCPTGESEKVQLLAITWIGG